MKDKILCLIPKLICEKGCYNSNNLWKCYMISTFYTEVASTYSITPSEPFCPRTKNRGKMFQMTVID